MHPVYHCPCGRERAAQTARLLDADEVAGLRARGEALEIRCEFCRELYRIEAEELEGIRAESA